MDAARCVRLFRLLQCAPAHVPAYAGFWDRWSVSLQSVLDSVRWFLRGVTRLVSSLSCEVEIRIQIFIWFVFGLEYFTDISE